MVHHDSYENIMYGRLFDLAWHERYLTVVKEIKKNLTPERFIKNLQLNQFALFTNKYKRKDYYNSSYGSLQFENCLFMGIKSLYLQV